MPPFMPPRDKMPLVRSCGSSNRIVNLTDCYSYIQGAFIMTLYRALYRKKLSAGNTAYNKNDGYYFNRILKP